MISNIQTITKTDANGQPTSETTKWIIKTGEEREWVLTATRYTAADGSKSKPYYRAEESAATRRKHAGELDITTDRDDDNPTVGVNWPCRGTQSIAETAKFAQDIQDTIEAAREAQAIIDTETAHE